MKMPKSIFLNSALDFVVYMDAKDPKPSQELHSREALAPVFADLNKYAATMHFLGQTTILTLTNDRGTGETYCMPHHCTVDGGKRSLMNRRATLLRHVCKDGRHVPVVKQKRSGALVQNGIYSCICQGPGERTWNVRQRSS
jgi:hypothetical protein